MSYPGIPLLHLKDHPFISEELYKTLPARNSFVARQRVIEAMQKELDEDIAKDSGEYWARIGEYLERTGVYVANKPKDIRLKIDGDYLYLMPTEE